MGPGFETREYLAALGLRQPNSAGAYLTTLDEYKDALARLFPALPRRLVHSYSLSPIDALTVGHFLEHSPRRAIVLEIGTFVGASAFCFASHPRVSRVIGVDPNPLISDEITANSDKWVNEVDFESLEGLRVLDVARAALAEFDGVGQKTEFCEGVVGTLQTGVEKESVDVAPERVEVPAVDPSGEARLVVFVDGLHTKEGVRADLEAIFGRNPHAVAFLDDCCHRWGSSVQAGVLDFVDRSGEEYHFRLVKDLFPELWKSNLGIIYADSVATETEETLTKVGGSLKQRLDSLRLLRREDNLIRAVDEVHQELVQMRKQTDRLEKKNSNLKENNSELRSKVSHLKNKNSELISHYSSRRYKFTDVVVEKILRVAGLRNLLRRRQD